MRYATKFDWLLVVAGLLCSISSGGLGPSACIIFQGITNALIAAQAQLDNDGQIDIPWFTSEMLIYIQMYFYLGIAIFILEYIAMSCFFTLCERQVHRIRQEYLSTVLNQNIGWFDQNEVGKLTQKMSS